LQMHNENRPEMVSRSYLDWRYLNEKNTPPVIFWVQQSDGTIVGMASLIFHRYWVNNEAHNFAVLGDISLNDDVRGKGISRKLFQFINLYIERNNYITFVMPNNSASRGLSSTGWETKEKLVFYVYIIDPTEILLRFLRNNKIAALISKLYRNIMQYRLTLVKTSGYSIQILDEFDDAFNALWIDLPKQGLILKERSASSLHSRYGTHPDVKFYIVKIMNGNILIGYIIYVINKSTCIVYDIIAKNSINLPPMLSLFVKHQINNDMIKMVRIPMNDNNIYAGSLRKSGFIKRQENNIIQIFASSSHLQILKKYQWFITAGDKDV
jgi:hypothetical protein